MAADVIKRDSRCLKRNRRCVQGANGAIEKAADAPSDCMKQQATGLRLQAFNSDFIGSDRLI